MAGKRRDSQAVPHAFFPRTTRGWCRLMASSVSQGPPNRSRYQREDRVVAHYLVTKLDSRSTRYTGSWEDTPKITQDVDSILHEAWHIARQAASGDIIEQQWGEGKLTRDLKIGHTGEWGSSVPSSPTDWIWRYAGTIGSSVYAYNIAPPECDTRTSKRRVLDDWIYGEPVQVQEDEIYVTAELEDFIVSEYGHCWNIDPPSPPRVTPAASAGVDYRLDVSSLANAVEEVSRRPRLPRCRIVLTFVIPASHSAYIRC